MKSILYLSCYVVLFLSSCEPFEQMENPVACMSLSQNTFKVGDVLQLDDCSENSSLSYFIVNGETVGNQRTYYTYEFKEAGTYNLKLVSYNRNLRDEISKTVYVEPGEIEEVNVYTAIVENITSNSAISGGTIVTDGVVQSSGIVYGFDKDVSVDNGIDVLINDSDSDVYEIVMENLVPNLTYYVRAFAQVGETYYYGGSLAFFTLGGVRIDMYDPQNITVNSVDLSANVSAGDDAVVIDKGFLISPFPNPVYGGTEVKVESYGAGDGMFNGTKEGLSSSTLYHVCAFVVTNNNEYLYSSVKEFSTLSVGGLKSVNVEFTESAPMIDGLVDAMWDQVATQAINVPMHEGGNVSYTKNATFKALWDNENIYLLVEVPDDDFYPSVESGQASWLSDKPEIYFDVNEIREDGGGPEAGEGHHQIAPAYMEADDRAQWAYQISSSEDSYRVEYAVPFSTLVDNFGQALHPQERRTIGFDITLIDLDELGKGETIDNYQKVNWSNDGSIYESWNSMDDSGDFNFVSGGTSEPPSNEIVVFDPADYIGEILPEGMTIVEIGGEYFIQVILDGQNSKLGITDMSGLMGMQLEAHIQYVLGENTHNKGYGLGDIQNGIEVLDWDHQTVYDWEAPGTELHECWAAFWQETTNGLMEQRYAGVINPMDNAQSIRFYGQINNVWEYTVGDIILCGKIVAKKL